MSVQELEPQLVALSPEDKVQVIEMLAHELGGQWLGIEKNERVAGGQACIVRTRVPVWTLEGYRQLGWSDERILENYPTLRASDLLNAWVYVRDHRQEIQDAIVANETA
jgi:uncharacterized protein (DUF433 family)